MNQNWIHEQTALGECFRQIKILYAIRKCKNRKQDVQKFNFQMFCMETNVSFLNYDAAH